MRVWEVVEGSQGIDGLKASERPKPLPGPTQVLIRVHAASLNYRDLAIVTGKYFGGVVKRNTIPLSDGAGEVESIGEQVSSCKPGDRVVATFTQGGAALGSPLDGMLAEYVVLEEGGVLPIPGHLSFEEASTLPCAGVTAWNALTGGKCVRPGDTVLTLGTGGVSLFAVQIAKAAGARVIITSSSDEKLARAREAGADETINYVSQPEWSARVLELTNGSGVDHIVELGGAGTLPQSYASIGRGGEISLIGVLTPPDGDLSPHAMMIKGATLRGIFVGDRSLFEGLNKAISVNDLHPIIDREFAFEAVPDAYRFLESARHFGKIVVAI